MAVKPYRQNRPDAVNALFASAGVKKAKGRRVHATDGGYEKWGPKYGLRVYFEEATGCFHCQVYSEIASKLYGRDPISQYTVEGNASNLESVISAAFYNEYINRSKFEFLSGKETA